jgi:hypothetical protein
MEQRGPLGEEEATLGASSLRATLFVLLALVAVVASFGLWEWFLASRLAQLDPRTTGVAVGLPVPVAPDQWRFTRVEALALLCLIGVQCFALWTLAVAIPRIPVLRTVAFVVVAASAMAAISSTAKASTSSDPYFYILYAKAPTFASAYARAPIPVAPGFEPLERFRDEMYTAGPPPSIYGPAWLALSRLVVAGTSNVAMAFFALRALGLVAILLIVWAARGAGASAAVVSLIALNPALYHYGVVECHNDVVAIAFVFAGLTAAKRAKLIPAAMVAALAGLVKINFTAIALATLAGFGTIKQRIGAGALLVGVVIVGSAVFGGTPYLSFLVSRSARNGFATTMHDNVFLGLELADFAVALVAIALAIFAKTWWRRALWTLPATAVNQFWPWYVLWPLPISLRAGDQTALRYLIALPAASILLTRAFGLSLVGTGLMSVYLLFALLYALSEVVPLALRTNATLRAQKQTG